MRRVIDEKTRKRKWEATPNVRNEVADAETYCYAALLLGPVPLTMMSAEVERVNAEGKKAAEAQKPADQPQEPAAAPLVRAPQPRPRGGFVRRF
jgi:phage terminase large subunit GpA-like protein